MTRIRSSLDRLPTSSGPAEPDVTALRRRAFIEQGVVMIQLAQVADSWTKQVVINEARRQFDLDPGQPAKGTDR